MTEIFSILQATSKHSDAIQEDVRLQWILKSVISKEPASSTPATDETSIVITADMVDSVSDCIDFFTDFD